MPSQCSVSKCKSVKKLHSFPSDTDVKEKWSQFCKKPVTWTPSQSSKICSKHFQPSDFRSKGRLMPYAVPTIPGTYRNVSKQN